MRFTKYAENIRLDGRLFIFILLIINIYRLAFILLMQSYMGEGADDEIGIALWAGLRLSLKTAGGVALLSFVAATLPNIPCPRLDTRKNRWLIGVAAIFLLSVLFEGRFPYYRQFGMTYHLQVVQGLNDDMAAIFWTMAEEYGLVWRLAAACALTVVGSLLLRKWLAVNLSLPPVWLVPPTGAAASKKIGAGLAWLVITFTTALFIRFGGSFTYGGGINWENAGVTGDNFLNECILDDVQALYRAKENAQRMEAGHISGVETDKVRELARELADDPTVESNNLVDYITHRTQGAKLPKPQHIFIILGESWANWPIMDKYAKLNVAEGIKSLSREDNAFFTDRFMPNGDFTSIAITGLVTGLSEIVTRVNYQPRSFTAPYPTAMAPPFKRLGYRVDFWYGGVPSWDNINRLALAQGFDNFYGYMDYHAPKVTTWGTTDGYMFDALWHHLADEPPTVHLIMTVSNHPPYTLDLKSLGFDLERETELARSLGKVDDPAELAVELGHYWYMDKVTTDFVRKVSQEYPDTLFVITGDHAVRMNPGTTPTMFEQQGIPFLLYGAGVHKDILPPGAVGGHTYIVPTLLELIAPQGFAYVSVAPSMTKNPSAAFNRDFWLTDSAMGGVDNDKTETLPGRAACNGAAEKEKALRLIHPLRTLSWWLLHKGTELPQ